MAKKITIQAEVETTTLSVAVTSTPGSAGIAIASSVMSSAVTLTNTSLACDAQYKVGAGSWVELERNQGIELPISLASTQVYLRRTALDGGLCSVDVSIDGIANISAGSLKVAQLAQDANNNTLGIFGGDGYLAVATAKRAEKAPIPVLGGDIQLSDFSIAQGTPVLSIVTLPNGSKALKIVTNIGEDTRLDIPALMGTQFNGEAYISSDATFTNGVSNILFYVTPDANMSTNFASAGFGGYSAPLNTPMEPTQKTNTLRYGKADLAITGAITYPFTTGFARLRIIPRGGMSATVILTGIGFSPQPKVGRVCVVSDDGYDSWFQYGQPLFDDRGIPTTVAVIPCAMDTRNGYAFKRQLQGLINKGGAVVAHGPDTASGVGNLFTAFPTTEARIADMKSVRKWISDNGLATPFYDSCYVWPQGAWQTSASDTSLLDAAYAAGFTSGRGAILAIAGTQLNIDALSKYQHLTAPIIGHNWAGSTAAEATNVAAIVAAINLAAANGADIYVMLHRVQPTATSDGSMSSIGIRLGDLTTIADAIAVKIAAGTLKPVTMPQLSCSPSGNFWQQ
jgi:hypothetical protein